MKLNKFALLFSVVLGLFVALPVVSQTDTFSDPNAEYTFSVPDPQWKMTSKPTAISPNVEYVFKDRQDGHLEVRKITPKPDALLTETIRDEENRLQFLTGYVTGKEEQFVGKLKGMVFNYEFVKSGRNMSGRFYFLKTDSNSVYLLRFTGERDKLRAIRNFTDSIARTFEINKAK